MITIQIDIVFVDATQPGGAPGIDQLDHHHRGIDWQGTLAQGLQPFDLTTRTVKAFNPMSAAQSHQQALRTRIAKHRNISTQRLAERALERMRVLGQARASRSRRC